MIKDIVEVAHIRKYEVFLRFEDGASGAVDLANIIRFTGVFEPLKNVNYFSKVKVDKELGTIVWPNGADLDPEVLYSAVTGKQIVIFKEKQSGITTGESKFRELEKLFKGLANEDPHQNSCDSQ